MLIPTRCFTCGSVIADRWDAFNDRARDGDEDPEEVLDDLGIDRYCCRSIYLTHVDSLDDIARFTKE